MASFHPCVEERVGHRQDRWTDKHSQNAEGNQAAYHATEDEKDGKIGPSSDQNRPNKLIYRGCDDSEDEQHGRQL